MTNIAVLMGGWSREREVSLSSGKGVTEALQELGYQVTPIDVAPDIAEVLARCKPDAAFNALHGRFGEDGCIQGILEVLAIPYTHSGVLASAIAMDKPMAKKLFESVGLRCADGAVMTKSDIKKKPPFPFPFVVKPLNDGSSVDVHIVTDAATLQAMEAGDENMLIERFIPGREITVAVLDGEPLGALEIRPKQQFYDYTAKYTAGQAEHLVPAPLPKAAYEEVLAMAAKAHDALECRGLTRSDFRYDDRDGKLYILEVNTQPGMTPLSLAPEIAAWRGISYNALVERLVAPVLKRREPSSAKTRCSQ